MFENRRRRLTLAVFAVFAVVLTLIAVEKVGFSQRSFDDPEVQSSSGPEPASDPEVVAPTSTTTSPVLSAPGIDQSETTSESKVAEEARLAVAQSGTAPVILVLGVVPTGSDSEKAAQVNNQLEQLLETLPPGSFSNVSRDLTVRTVPMTVNMDALDVMGDSAFVDSVKGSRKFFPTAQVDGALSPSALGPTSNAANSVDGAVAAWAAGKKGAGKTVAVVDSGVDLSHPFFAGKVTWEGCFAQTSGSYDSPCPTGPMEPGDGHESGSAVPCPVATSAQCAHGTHVAGIAVGGSGASLISGVAPGASLVAVNIFSYSASLRKISANEGDIINALQWLKNNRGEFTGLSAVNLSVGDGVLYTSACDNDSLAPIIGELADVGIATVIASGNEGRSNGVSSPGCISRAITVGAIDDTTRQSTDFSNDGPQVDVMAPGKSICSSVPDGSGIVSNCTGPTGGTFQVLSGTSMATPAVAGAIAVLGGDGVPSSEWKSRLQRVAQGSNCVQASAYTIPMLRVDVALGISAQALGPCAPSAPIATLQSVSSARVSWLPPIATGTGSLVSYQVTASSGQSCSISVPSTSCIVSGLQVPSSVTFTLTAQSTTGTSPASIRTNSLTPSMMVPLEPARLVDTRTRANAGSTVDGVNLGRGPVGQGQTYDVQMSGRGGVGVTGAVAAVALNVTVVSPTASNFLTVYPTGTSRPVASNINFVAGQTIPNMAIVKVGVGGKITVYNEQGSSDVVIDVVGWFPTDSEFTGVAPYRLLDTRTTQLPLTPGESREFTVTGQGPVPLAGTSPGVGTVALNVTVIGPTEANFVSVFPGDSSFGGTSNINFSKGQTIANMVITKVSANGKIRIFNNAGFTNIAVDVVGWFPVESQFRSFAPQRFVDTRISGGPLAPGERREVVMTGRGGVPIAGVGSVALNVTVVGSTASNYLTVYPSGGSQPTASNLNFVAGQTIANMVIVKVGTGGKITLFNNAGFTPVLVDVVGYFPN
jgi:subtilisin family serine protease